MMMLIAAALFVCSAGAQQYKLKQSTGMMGMKTESTIYVKGMRKRTENGAMMGMPAPPVEIQQCDLRRTVKLNDKKKLYFIEPFRNGDENNEEPVKTAAKTKPVPSAGQPKKGGVIYNYYTITDTGERKKIHGFTARHIWTTRRMVPDANACMMKDSMLIRTDGWYIDLPEFNCPVNAMNGGMNGGMGKPDCIDRFVSKQSGKGKLGFPLTETMVMIMGNGGQRTEFTKELETIELSTVRLDSMLFEIPPGYTQTMNEEDLQEKMDYTKIAGQYPGAGNDADNRTVPATENGPKPAGYIRIGVLPLHGEGELSPAELQQHLAASLAGDQVQGIPVTSKEDAKSRECDYLLSTQFTRIKQGSKLGGLLKAVKNGDPGAGSSITIDTEMILTKMEDGSTLAKPQTSGKYEGKINDAARKALGAGANQVLKSLEH